MNIIKNPKGFSLVELIVVIAIVSILFSVAVPSFVGYLPKVRANGFARNMATDIQWTRMMAVKENTTYYMAFDITNNKYIIYKDINSNGPEIGEEVRSVNTEEINRGIKFGFTANTIGPDNVGVINNSISYNTTTIGSNSWPTISFTPKGFFDQSGYIYIIPSNDTIASNMRAIKTTRTGQTKIFVYTSVNNPPWE